MPEINPLTNNQLFLKKIAENTGSNYETGDVSEINPLTIDQIFLKEIAANTAGQSGDITELEGKVADNTGAIESIVNEYGAKNLLPNNAISGTYQGVTFTVNVDGTITANGTPTLDFPLVTVATNFLLKAGSYILSSGLDSTSIGYMELFDSAQTYSIASTLAKQDGEVLFTLNADTYVKACAVIYMSEVATDVVFKPMICDARITDPTYVPYAMTNRELTEKVKVVNVNMAGHSVNDYISVDLPDGFTLSNTVILSHNIHGYGQIYSESTDQLESGVIVHVFISESDSKLNVRLVGANTPNCSVDVVLMKK